MLARCDGTHVVAILFDVRNHAIIRDAVIGTNHAQLNLRVPASSAGIEGVLSRPLVSEVELEFDRQVQVDRESGAVEFYEIAEVAPVSCGLS